MLRHTYEVEPTDLDADSICLSQTPAAGGVQALTIAGVLADEGVATLGAAQKVTVTSAGNDLGRTFTLTGTDADGQAQTEAVTGASGGAATSAKYFKTVSAVTVDDDTADAVTVGHTSVSISPTLVVSGQRTGYHIGFGCTVTGTINYTVQQSYDDPTSLPVTNWNDHPTAAGKTASFDGSYVAPVAAVRILVNSASTGSVTGVFLQDQV